MSALGQSLRRIRLIAERDFLGYVRTWGFWITILSPFIGIGIGFGMSLLSLKAEPTRYAAIVDETGRYETQIIDAMETKRSQLQEDILRQSARFVLRGNQRDEMDAALATGGYEAGLAYLTNINPEIASRITLPLPSLRIVPAPSRDIDALKLYLSGQESISVEGAPQNLTGVLHIKDTDDGLEAQYLTTQYVSEGLESTANSLFLAEQEAAFFEGAGLKRGDFWSARGDAVKTRRVDPLKPASADGGGQDVTAADSMPSFVAAGLSMLLWFSIFSGAYMLLTSMVEEKVNKALEMLLASTRFSEIMLGKLLGVVVLTIASMLPWVLMASVGFVIFLLAGDAGLAAALLDAVSVKMLVLFGMFFILGYVFYGALFMALGSMAESTQDAQTLVTPIMLLLTFCVMVVPIGLSAPDSKLLTVASFIPFSAPFAVLMRLPENPPMWEVALSGGVLLLSALGSVWLAARIFRFGVLTGGGMAGLKTLITSPFSRRSKG